MESQCLHLHHHHRHRHLASSFPIKRHSFDLSLPIHLPIHYIRHAHPPLHLKCSPRSPLPPISASKNSNPPTQLGIDADSDLAPVPPSRRTFTAWDLASLWVGLVVGVPSYYLAGSLVDLGMAWWQGVATVSLANLILLFPLVLTAVPGARHGLAFPVLARSAFGVRGAHVPSLLRALVGCGWYGIESWIGGQAVFLLLPPSIKNASFATAAIPFLGTSNLEFLCFIAFWLAQLAIVLRGMDGIRELEKYSAPILITLTSALLCWAYIKAGGFGRMLSTSSRLSWPEFL